MPTNTTTDRPPVPLYAALARAVGAYHRCVNAGNTEWQDRHEARIKALCDRYMPAGSGLDTGPRLDVERSTEEKLIIERADFHHMNESGFYDGWTEHEITVRPSLAFGFALTISGRNRDEIKEYLHDTFHAALSTMVDEFPEVAHA